MKKKWMFFLIAALCVCICAAAWKTYDRPRPLMDDPDECRLLQVQRNVDGVLTDVEVPDAEAVLDVLRGCEVRRSFQHSGTVPVNTIDLLLILQDEDGLFTVLLGERDYVTRERGSQISYLLDGEQVKQQLYKVLERKEGI